MLEPDVQFAKWQDPFAMPSDINQESEWEEHDDDEHTISKRNTGKPVRVLTTPMGVFPLGEHNQPGEIFDFWVGHVNFTLSKPVIRVINKVEGVEALDIYSRYRFRIGVGKLFKAGEVMADIRKALLAHVKNRQLIINDEKEELPIL